MDIVQLSQWAISVLPTVKVGMETIKATAETVSAVRKFKLGLEKPQAKMVSRPRRAALQTSDWHTYYISARSAKRKNKLVLPADVTKEHVAVVIDINQPLLVDVAKY